jgi:hypothetical protein
LLFIKMQHLILMVFANIVSLTIYEKQQLKLYFKMALSIFGAKLFAIK